MVDGLVFDSFFCLYLLLLLGAYCICVDRLYFLVCGFCISELELGGRVGFLVIAMAAFQQFSCVAIHLLLCCSSVVSLSRQSLGIFYQA